MWSLRVAFVLVVLCAVSSVNHGYPQTTPPTYTVADVTDTTTNQNDQNKVAITGGTTPRPVAATREDQNVDEGTTSTSNEAEDIRTTEDGGPAPIGETNDVHRDGDAAPVNDADDDATLRGDDKRPVADLSTGVHHRDVGASSDEKTGSTGFPWWSLLVILSGTILVVIGIAVPFYMYNRRLNHQRGAVKKSKRASEIVVDSWIAVSHSSASSDGEHDEELVFLAMPGMTAGDGASRENILGAEGEFEMPSGIVHV